MVHLDLLGEPELRLVRLVGGPDLLGARHRLRHDPLDQGPDQDRVDGLLELGADGRVAAQAEAAGHGIQLEVVRHPGARRGFVLLPRRWVIERSFAWASRFRRPGRDYGQLPSTGAGLHFIAFACLMRPGRSLAGRRFLTRSSSCFRYS